MEVVKAHCERCYDDKDETSQTQEERIQEQRHSGNSLVAWTGRKVEACRMMMNKGNGPSDCTVTAMLQELFMESVHEVAHWFGKRFRGRCRAPAVRTLLRRAIALRSVLVKWYAAVVVGQLGVS